jgi:hypothetical protein
MKRAILILMIATLAYSLPAFCQKSITDSTLSAIDTLNNDFGLFTKDDILHLALRFDLRTYTSKKPTDEYLPAVLTYFVTDKDSINKEIKLKSRGVVRNDICSFPPLMLNLKNAGFEKEDIKNIEKIKVVTHCQYGNENYLFMEYLVYKLYNVLTDYSFRVRLAKMDYINTGKKGKSISSYCFFIEPLNILAKRVGSIPVTSLKLSQQNVIPSFMDRMAIFNYMIGNTDWSVPNQHNCKILTGVDFNYPGLGIIVPYDFDYSGIINTDYAVPYEGLGLKSVLERRYLGACRSKEEYINALKEFKDKKSEFYKVIDEFPFLNEKVKKGMRSYLDDFFSSLENGNDILNKFENGCYKF